MAQPAVARQASSRQSGNNDTELNGTERVINHLLNLNFVGAEERVTSIPQLDSKTSAKHLFGLKTLWRGSAKVAISDPARTLIDMISAPKTGGGIDHVAECLRTYLGDNRGDRDLLINYAEQLGNGAVFKRLGFLADHADTMRQRHLNKAAAKQETATTVRIYPLPALFGRAVSLRSRAD
jgi:predicted transcriptional regulator of viral defense system